MIYYKKNQKIKGPLNSFLYNDKRRNKISDNEINNYSLKKEFNNKKVINISKKNNNLRIKKSELKKEFLKLDLDKITNNVFNLKKVELSCDNKNIHLKEDRNRRMLSEPIENKEIEIFKIKNNKIIKNTINNKIYLNKTIENNNLDMKFLYLKEENGEKQNTEKDNKDDYNIIFNRTGTNFNTNKKLIENILKFKVLNSFLIKIDKSQKFHISK